MVLKRSANSLHSSYVWEWCKNVWYSNGVQTHYTPRMFENDVKMYGTQTIQTPYSHGFTVWEWCKNVWYSNESFIDSYGIVVWEWCKNVWYSNFVTFSIPPSTVWEWCKNVWYSNKINNGDDSTPFENDVKMYGTQTTGPVHINSFPFENDVKMYGTQTVFISLNRNISLRMM